MSSSNDSENDIFSNIFLSLRSNSSGIMNDIICECSGIGHRKICVDAEKFKYLERVDGFRYPSYMSHDPIYYRCYEGTCSCACKYGNIIPIFRVSSVLPGLPELKDKYANKIRLYRAELKGVGIIGNLIKFNRLVMIITESRREFQFSGLCIETICAFYKMKGRKYVPILPRYYIPIEYFWLTIKILKKLYRQYPTQLDPLINDLCRKFGSHSWLNCNGIPGTQECRNAHEIIGKEFKKFCEIIRHTNEIGMVFKEYLKRQITKTFYREHHWYIGILIKRLNNIESNMGCLGLTKYHKEYFMDDMLLTKKRLYQMIVKLDEDMKRTTTNVTYQHGDMQPLRESESDPELDPQLDLNNEDDIASYPVYVPNIGI